MRSLLVLMSITAALALQAQTISGKIIDDKQHPVKSASVSLLKQKDSSLVRSFKDFFSSKPFKYTI
jgi:hypothetical protein